MTETRYDVPGGGIAPPIAMVLIAWLLSGIPLSGWIASAVVVAIAAAVYLARRGNAVAIAKGRP